MTPPLVADVILRILHYLQPDPDSPLLDTTQFRATYKCIFINKRWCEVASAFLWSRPFAFSPKQNKKLLCQYFSMFTIKERIILLQNGVPLPSVFNKPPLFDYPSFVRHLFYPAMVSTVKEWLAEKVAPNMYNLKSEIGQPKNPMKVPLIVRALLKLFIKHGSHIESVHIYSTRYFVSPEEYLLLKEPYFVNWIFPIKKLLVDADLPNFEVFLAMASLFRNLTFLRVQNINRDPIRIGDFIRSQNGLVTLEIYSFSDDFDDINISPIMWALESQRDTLRRLCFKDVSFDFCEPWIGLPSCQSLQELLIINCEYITKGMSEPLFDSIFPELKNLRVECTKRSNHCTEFLQWAKRFSPENHKYINWI
ncbi:hypothetical protein G9A89_009186 [Geosiphon pyriformis]|nr:hypothetical protein G9A89_009186 [Geosiphon pyriformis]